MNIVRVRDGEPDIPTDVIGTQYLSPTAMKYELIRHAIIERRSLTCTYDDCSRSFSPHILGESAEGRLCVIAFQYAGARPGGSLSSAGEWCCFDIEKISRLRENEDRWVAGPIGERPTVKEISVKA